MRCSTWGVWGFTRGRNHALIESRNGTWVAKQSNVETSKQGATGRPARSSITWLVRVRKLVECRLCFDLSARSSMLWLVRAQAIGLPLISFWCIEGIEWSLYSFLYCLFIRFFIVMFISIVKWVFYCALWWLLCDSKNDTHLHL